MELDEFVTSTIQQILKGVKDAQNDEDFNEINPVIGANNGKLSTAAHSHRTIHSIQFDVAVTTEDKNGAGGKAKISVLGTSLGGGLDTENLSKVATRIQFKIPITYPYKRRKQND